MRTLRQALIFSPLLIAVAQAANVAVTPAELAEARRWSAAKFEGRQLAPASEPALVVLANHGAVCKNARGDRPMHIVDKEYSHGLYCHAPSKIVVRLPGPGARFTALGGLELADQFAAVFRLAGQVREGPLARLQHRTEEVEHFRKLREDEHPLAFVHQPFELLEEGLGLGAEGG